MNIIVDDEDDELSSRQEGTRSAELYAMQAIARMRTAAVVVRVPDGRGEPELPVGGLLVDHVRPLVAQSDRQHAVLQGNHTLMR
jgi:hypothetical protein